MHANHHRRVPQPLPRPEHAQQRTHRERRPALAQIQLYVPETQFVPCLAAVARFVASAEKCFETPVVSVRVSACKTARLRPTALRITNICGKIKHYHSAQFFNPGVLPFVKNTRNAFGDFETVYSVKGNLQTAQNRVNTLFRGGRCSKGILLSIDHVFDPECIEYVHMHMIVANVRLEQPINVDCLFLNHDPRWQYRFVAKTEDQTYMKSFKLSGLCLVWQASLLGEAADKDLAVMVNLGKSGSVNLFVTIGQETLLAPGAEHRFTPLLNVLVELVEQST